MAALHEITVFLDDFLELEKFSSDVSNNGLQFEGVHEVARAAFAVDACEAVFRAAAEWNADFIFVHHGISWGSGFRCLRGGLARRIAALASGGISLYAAHLPLDAHEMIGHNALLSSMIGLKDLVPFGDYHGYKIGFRGVLEKPVSPAGLACLLDRELPSSGDFRFLGDPETPVRRVGVISGGGAWPALFDEMEETATELLVTGCAGHEEFHPAREAGASVLMLGHYRSETPGVIAVMNCLREKFRLETRFFDCPTGL